MRPTGDACAGDGNPFVSHANSSARWRTADRPTRAPAGCRNMPCCGVTAARSSAVVPMYAKSHSYGEYVFDHGWANAHGAGRRAVLPETPGRGAVQPGAGSAAVAPPRVPDVPDRDHRETHCNRRCQSHGAVLCPRHLLLRGRNGTGLGDAGWLRRIGMQFHWENEGFSGRLTISSACCHRASARFCGASGGTPTPPG